MNQSFMTKAVDHLRNSDTTLYTLIEKYGPCTLRPSLNNLFHALASSIISQQLSIHAAKAIEAKFLDSLGAQYFTPEDILKIPSTISPIVGVSKAKLRYIRGLALAVESGNLNFTSILKNKDEEIISKLISFSGIGTWTAEMFLIFGLGRPDVLSASDAALRKAFKVNYKLSEPPSAEEMISISKPWRPYRSIASWYLWRTLD